MSTDLYEILDIQADATPEQIRKAYKRQALKTHPDRAPPGEKAQAEEKFRQVNNAYEVLTDPQKRQSYDRHRVWPPPPEEPPRHSQSNTRSQPFYPGNIFTFTDPFELFESLFGHPSPLHAFHDPFQSGASRTFFEPAFAPSPFPTSGPLPFRPFDSGAGMGGGLFHGIPPHDSFMVPVAAPTDFFYPQPPGNFGRSASYFSSTSSYSANRGMGGGPWVSESRSTTTVNNQTTRIHERVDSSGNVHTTTTHPDGNRTYTINGVLQPLGQIDAPPLPYSPYPTAHRPHRHRHCDQGYPRGGHHRHRGHGRGYSQGYSDYPDLPHQGP